MPAAIGGGCRSDEPPPSQLDDGLKSPRVVGWPCPLRRADRRPVELVRARVIRAVFVSRSTT